jgi:hypothetical protein
MPAEAAPQNMDTKQIFSSYVILLFIKIERET